MRTATRKCTLSHGTLTVGHSTRRTAATIKPAKSRGFFRGSESQHIFSCGHHESRSKSLMYISVTTAQASSVPAGQPKQRVCVLGGGFGGLYTALRLNSLPWSEGERPEVVLVDQNDKFVFKPLLYELLNGGVTPEEVAPSFQDLLASTNVTFRKASVDSIEPPAENGSSGCVKLVGGDELEYDWLVLAMGAQAKLGVVPGVMQHALPFSTFEDAKRVDHRLHELEAAMKQGPSHGASAKRVAVVGGGPSGVELAAVVAERLGNLGDVQLLTSGQNIIADNPQAQADDARKVLQQRRVGIMTSCLVKKVEAAETGEYTIVLEDGREIETDLVLWTAGQAPVVPKSQAVGAYGLPLAKAGEAVTDAFLRVRSHPRMFALGDAAYVTDSKGQKLPATAQVAFQAADYAGWNVWASINNRPLLPFKYQHLGDMMALGESDGSVAFPFDATLSGLPASVLRKAAYVYRQPTLEQAMKVGMGFVSRPLQEIVKGLASSNRK